MLQEQVLPLVVVLELQELGAVVVAWEV